MLLRSPVLLPIMLLAVQLHVLLHMLLQSLQLAVLVLDLCNNVHQLAAVVSVLATTRGLGSSGIGLLLLVNLLPLLLPLLLRLLLGRLWLWRLWLYCCWAASNSRQEALGMLVRSQQRLPCTDINTCCRYVTWGQS